MLTCDTTPSPYNVRRTSWSFVLVSGRQTSRGENRFREGRSSSFAASALLPHLSTPWEKLLMNSRQTWRTEGISEEARQWLDLSPIRKHNGSTFGSSVLDCISPMPKFLTLLLDLITPTKQDKDRVSRWQLDLPKDRWMLSP